MSTPDYTVLPANLPVPVDDGACDHLRGMPMPCVRLPSTDDCLIDLSELAGRTVVYAYPRTGRPGNASPDGWDAIPGARGCTPESCAFRDHYAELQATGAEVFGLSTQSSEEQREAVERLHLPFEILSDTSLALTRALKLPTFRVAEVNNDLIKRLTLVIDEGCITHVFYPVFPPEKHAEEVLAWLKNNPA